MIKFKKKVANKASFENQQLFYVIIHFFKVKNIAASAFLESLNADEKCCLQLQSFSRSLWLKVE